jgi:hypothetical protein
LDLVVIGIAGYVLIGAIPCGYLALRFTWRNGLENLAVVKRLQYSAGAGVALSVANAARVWAADMTNVNKLSIKFSLKWMDLKRAPT